MISKNLYIISNKQKYIDKLKSCLDFNKYNHVYSLLINDGNTMASYIRSVRISGKFNEDYDDMLVVYENVDPFLTDMGSVYYLKEAAYIYKRNEKHYCVHCVNEYSLDAHMNDIKNFIK